MNEGNGQKHRPVGRSKGCRKPARMMAVQGVARHLSNFEASIPRFFEPTPKKNPRARGSLNGLDFVLQPFIMSHTCNVAESWPVTLILNLFCLDVILQTHQTFGCISICPAATCAQASEHEGRRGDMN